MAKGPVYLVRTKIAEGREAEWNAWHRQVHVPMVLAEPGFRRARRLRQVEGDDDHRYWTLYDVESVPALQAYRQGPSAMRIQADHQARYGAVSDLRRATFEVLDELRGPLAPSEVAALGPSLSLLLRPATTADETAVLALLPQLTEEGSSPPIGPAEARASFQQYLGDAGSGIFIAEMAGKVVAFASVTTYPTMRFGRRGHVEDLCVDPSVRHHGVAHRLLDYVERWMKREGVSHLSTVIGLHREESRRFLTHEGFVDASLVLRKRWASAPPGTPG